MGKHLNPRKLKPLAERFWAKVQKLSEYECWLWLGNKTYGYGIIQHSKAGSPMLRAHRVSWEMAYGAISDGLLVCHKCDNPSCVNPNHLFLGTQKDNRQDCKNKGRTLSGERNPMAKLTDAQRNEIMKSTARLRDVMAKFNISESRAVTLRRLGKEACL